jgi:hypothetical protein
LEWFRTIPRLTEVSLDQVPPKFTAAFFAALNRNTDASFLPHLRSLEFVYSWHDIDAPVLAALHSRFPAEAGSPPAGVELGPAGAHIESMHFTCGPVEYGDRVVWRDIGEIDWDSLWDLGIQGSDVHVGSEEQNFLWHW